MAKEVVEVVETVVVVVLLPMKMVVVMVTVVTTVVLVLTPVFTQEYGTLSGGMRRGIVAAMKGAL